PFEGTSLELLRRRVDEDPRPPSALAREVPAELDRLCMRLLGRDPASRGDGETIFAALGREISPSTRLVMELATPQPFGGRARALGVLEDAQGQASGGASVFLAVTGDSGMGKTTLIRHFLDRLDPRDFLVLQGRCYEREMVPYPAIDSLVDAVANR